MQSLTKLYQTSQSNMIFNQTLLFITLVLFLSSCSDTKDTNIEVSKQKVPSQIGTFFDRVIEKNESKYEDSIFSIKSEMTGTQGVAIYLGEFKGHKLFMTNKHVIDQNIDSCDDWISLVDTKSRIYFGCKGFIYSFENLDITILAMDSVINFPVIRNPDDSVGIEADVALVSAAVSTENVDGSDQDFVLKPIDLRSITLDTSASLILRSLDLDYSAIVVDKSTDCVNLDTEPLFITDPDVDSESPITTWSLPVGCDAKPGDSGAPIFNAEGDLMGILWGGKLNKTFVNSESLKKQLNLNSSSLWTDYNFMVPVSNILEELDLALQKGILSAEVQEALSGLLNNSN
jgi:hypothetical protein